MLKFNRRPAAIVVALVLGAASVQAAADGDRRSDGDTPEPAARPAATTAPVADHSDAIEPKQTLPPDEAKDDWPTDDFGRPLRSCDVPWDFVPRKR